VWLERELIGVIGTHARGRARLEIGYWIGTSFQRRGYATEAAPSVVRRLQQVHPGSEVTAECKRGNKASWDLLHKLGFRSTRRQGDRPGRELLAIPKG
jgi:RimJ/RimL family protein N-acetyltransferase